VLRFAADCRIAPAAIEVGYSLFFDFDAQHKGLAQARVSGQVQSLCSRRSARSSASCSRGVRYAPVLSYGREGVWAYLDRLRPHPVPAVAALAGAAACASGWHWLPVARFGDAFWTCSRS